MNFMHPERLLALVAVVALAGGYLWVLRRNHQARQTYANPALMNRLASQPSGRLRHLSPLLCLLALGALVVGIAQPTRAEAVPRHEGVVVLALDVSASMAATDVTPSRLQAAITGASDFVSNLPDGLHVGLVAFDGQARLLVAPTKDRGEVQSALTGLETGPGTAAGDAIASSLNAAESVLSPDVLASGKDLPVSVVLLSDGSTTMGRPIASGVAQAKSLGVPVTTIAFGTQDGTVTLDGETVPVPADVDTMKAVATETGGSAFEASSAGELKDVYSNISSVVGTTTEHHEVTRGLLGFAFIAAAAAFASSVWSRGRAL